MHRAKHSQQHAMVETSSQAKGTKSTSFHMCVRNEEDLVPLACEDVVDPPHDKSSKVVLVPCDDSD